MPDRTCFTHFFLLGGIAAFISFGRSLSLSRMPSIRVTLGRMIVAFGLGGSAAFLGFFMPDAPMYIQMGLASAMATLGTDVITSIVQYRLGNKHE